MRLHNVKFDNMEKFQGCYLISKKDHSVFVTPMFCAGDKDAELPGGRQKFLDNDYAGFAFSPTNLIMPCKSNREDATLSCKLFCHTMHAITGFTVEHH